MSLELSLQEIEGILRREDEFIEMIIEAVIKKAEEIQRAGLNILDSPVICYPEIYSRKDKSESIRKKLRKLPEKQTLVKISLEEYSLECRISLEVLSRFVLVETRDGQRFYISENDKRRNIDKIKKTVRENPNVKGIVVTLSLNVNGYTISVNALKLISDAIANGFGDEVKRILLLIKMLLTNELSHEEFIFQIREVIRRCSSKNVWVASVVGSAHQKIRFAEV
jgi:hypothetical protein